MMRMFLAVMFIWKIHNAWKLNNTFLNNRWIKEQIKQYIKKFLRQMKIKTYHSKTWEMWQKQI